MDKTEEKLCEVQGRLFAASREAGYESEPFIKAFMRSCMAKGLDENYNHLQWAGEEYLLEELQGEAALAEGDNIFEEEVLYWMGYAYRYWHFMTGESSKIILRMAPVPAMRRKYKKFHGLDLSPMVEKMRESYLKKHPPKSKK